MSSFKAGIPVLATAMAAASLGVSAVSAQAPIASAQQIEDVRDSYIFVFEDYVAGNAANDRARQLVGQANGQLRHVYTTAIRGFSARMPAEAAARLAANNPQIAYFEADQIAFPFPPPPGRGPGGGGDDGGGGSGPAQETPWGISRVGGAAAPTGRAFVIDSGVDLDHPDLNVNVADSRNFVSKGRDNGGDDTDGHGTHVAGTIGAIDNNIGVIGVAPGAEIVAVRVLGNNGGSYSDVIAGVDYAAQIGQPGDVANMSLGGGRSDALNTAVENAAASSGVVFVLAAGNSGADSNNYSPASANGANVLTVSATDINDNFASFSNYANPPVDCAAPGVAVFSTYGGGGYATLSGTSMAAPHVAGLVISGGANSSGAGGFANGDPDGDADPICVR